MKKQVLTLLLLAATSAVFADRYPAPQKKDLEVGELEGRKFDLAGKVVEVKANYFYSLRQVSNGEYSIYCNYHESDYSSSSVGIQVLFSGKEAYEFFQDLIEDRGSDYSYGSGSDEDFFLYMVKDGNNITFRAIGKRYRKGKGYSW